MNNNKDNENKLGSYFDMAVAKTSVRLPKYFIKTLGVFCCCCCHIVILHRPPL